MHFRTDFTQSTDTTEAGQLYVPKELQEKRCLDAVSLIKLQVAPYQLLDVGCGFGTLLEYIEDSISLYTGIDINPEYITACKIKYPQYQFEHLGMEAMSPQLDYDIVVCLGVASFLKPTEDSLKWFIEKLCASARKAVVIELQDAERYKGHFTAFTKKQVSEVAGLFLNAKTLVQREEDTTFCVRIPLI